MYILIFLIVLLIALFLIYLRVKKGDVKELAPESQFEVLEVRISRIGDLKKDIKTAALAAENMFVSLHGLLHEDVTKQERLSFEIVFSGKEGIKFYVTVPSTVTKFVESQIYAHINNATITVVPDYTKAIVPADHIYQAQDISLSKPYFFPLKTFRDFESDPLSAVTSALSNIRVNEEFWFQVVLKPIPDVWQAEGLSYISTIRDGLTWGKGPTLLETFSKTASQEVISLLGRIATGLFVNKEIEEAKGSSKSAAVKLSPAQDLELKSIENKLSRVGYSLNMRAISFSDNEGSVRGNLRNFSSSLKQFSGVNTNFFTFSDATEKGLEAFLDRKLDDKKALILNAEELGTLYHFPSVNVETPNIAWAYSKKSEPPTNLPSELNSKDCVYLGDTMYRSVKTRFGIHNNQDRLRHMYVVGKSGVGKSTLFQTMAMQDIKNGAGLCMLDPHGETIDKVLEYIPEDRIKDVVYIDPSDADRPVGLNLLEIDDPSERNLMASGLLAAIKHHFDYSWGPRLEYLLNYALLTLVSIPGTTMLSVVRLLEDKNYRNYIVHQIEDPVLKKFWEVEYKEMANNPKFITEAVSPIQNKVNRFLASSTMRNLLGQARSTIDIWDIMQNKKILLINLSKGKIGTDNANLLGALLVSRIQFYALQRAKIKEQDRTPFYLYVDEFQNFATGSFGEILSESRKYGLGLYLTNQFTAQLDEQVLKSVLGNVGSIVTFAAGSMDARVMASEFQPFTADDIISLQRFQVYIKLMIDGMTSLPFSARILLPWEDAAYLPPATNHKEKVLQLSRDTYGVPREYVEAKIAKWINMNFDKGLAISETYRKTESKSN